MSGEGMDGSGFDGESGSGFIADFMSGDGEDADEEEEDLLELVEVPADFYWIAYIMRLFAATHSLISLAMLVAYYHLKVRDFSILAHVIYVCVYGFLYFGFVFL